jgi:hypothetical protein
MPARPDPHHRVVEAQRAIAAGATPVDPRVQALVAVIQGTSQDAALQYAWDKYQVPFQRIVIESYLLVDTLIEDINNATGVSREALLAYRDHIFDATVFRDRLDCISYVDNCRGYIPRNQQAFLEAAITHGPDYISWLLNRRPAILPRKVLETAMVEGHYMGLAHRGTDPTSERAKQAQRWLQNSTQAATQLLRVDPKQGEDALEHLRIALAYENNILTPKMLGAPAPEDIVH